MLFVRRDNALDQWVPDYERPIDGTPCRVVLDERRLVHYADRILELFPEEHDLRRMGGVSYMGVPLLDVNQTLGLYMGSLYVTNFNDFGRYWQVTIQADGRR